MSEFLPCHVPSDVDAFTAAYLGAAEWLLDEDVDRDSITGWHPDAIAKAKADCAKFQADHWEDLEEFHDNTCRDESLSGYCFWLNRNGAGTGFWDRDAGDVGDTLSKACKAFGSVDTYISDDNQICFG